MRVLIIGSNARTGGARYCERYVTFAGMIAAAHRSAGDFVAIRNWEPDLLREGWGRIYVGLASPAYVGSDRIYGTLIAIAELRDGPDHDPRLRFFIDDPDLRVLRNAIASVAAEPSRILAPFNAKRQDYELVVNDDSYLAKIKRGLKILNSDDEPWPITYIPAFPWGDTADLGRSLHPLHRAQLRAVDPTPFVPMDELATEAVETSVSTTLVPHDPFWLAESAKSDPWVRSTHVRSPVLGVKVGTDVARVALYRQAMGVLEPKLSTTGAGWWSSRMVMAAAAGTYYATDWRSLRDMASNLPYVQALPGAFEDMNELERSVLAEAQRDALLKSTCSETEALEALNVVV